MPSCSKAKNPQGIEITFTEADHRYRSIIDGKEISYISGTTFLGKFFKPFDPTGEITRKCALKRGVTVEALKEEWRLKGLEATTYGTRVHETCEDVFNGREFRNTPNNTKEEFAFKHAKRISAKIKERLDILGIEYIVFNRPIIFYAYDLERFESSDRGFYENYREYVPGIVVSDTEGIINAINGQDEYSDKRKYFYDDAYEYKDGKSTERLLKLIL